MIILTVSCSLYLLCLLCSQIHFYFHLHPIMYIHYTHHYDFHYTLQYFKLVNADASRSGACLLGNVRGRVGIHGDTRILKRIFCHGGH